MGFGLEQWLDMWHFLEHDLRRIRFLKIYLYIPAHPKRRSAEIDSGWLEPVAKCSSRMVFNLTMGGQDLGVVDVHQVKQQLRSEGYEADHSFMAKVLQDVVNVRITQFTT